MNARETAWRLFSSELNTATHEIKGTDEKSPSYVVTHLGAMVNRVLVAGVLTEKENVGSEDEPMWRGRIQDLASGNFFINIGRYQPEAAKAIADIDAPEFVAVIGKVKTYTTEDERVFVSIRPERIIKITEEIRMQWILDAAKSTWIRLNQMKKATAIEDVSEKDLITAGFDQKYAQGITTALDQYGIPNSTTYLKTIQTALRTILPDKNIDLGLPEDMSQVPDEIDIEPGATAQNNSDLEDTILNLLEELDTDGKGAPRDELERRAETAGISSMELEEISNILMDKGLVYEPNLRYLKRI
ncbi:MAG: glycerol dehydrogenase [Candidatus Methanomethylophilaceae archaeon]|nr:glycerol dehydrogenase [Candidatus Methanomethylophilaceae archaeon]MDD3378893.1 glycerol dehydrogenase [Candidatus Methanomethylophilaceae archaeon]MDY0223910.1 glycerol dehydrogenase [Candidatus Methanomethylophilaceae archaeon]